jgi:hypothetical protein
LLMMPYLSVFKLLIKRAFDLVDCFDDWSLYLLSNYI